MKLRLTAAAMVVIDGVVGYAAAEAQTAGSPPSAVSGLRGTSSDAPTAFAVGSVADQFRTSASGNNDPFAPGGSIADPAAAPSFAEPPRSQPAGEASDAASASPAASFKRRPWIAKPLKPVKQYGPAKPIVKHPLPPLQPYLTAIRPRGGQLAREAAGRVPPLRAPLRGTLETLDPSLDPALTNPPPVPPPTIASIPAPERRPRPTVDAAPYAPVGVRVGSLRLFPYVETDGGYDSNPDQTVRSSAKPSAFVRVEGGGKLESDWTRHSLTADLHGGYYDYFSNRNANRPDANGTVNSRIDVTRDFTIDSVGRFTVSTQRPGSPEIVLGQAVTSLNSRPLIYTYGGETGVTKKFNRLSVSLRGSVDHFGFEDANLGNGTVIPLSRDNYTAYVAKARLSYELTPGLTPFAEGFGSARRYDSRIDSAGTFRNSTGEGARIGSTYEVTRLLTGELALGYENRDYADRRLRGLRAPLVDGSLVYKPTALTTVSLKATSELNETNIPLSSGAVSRLVALEVSHALFRNVTLTGLMSYQNISYSGVKLNEDLYDIGLKAEYNLSRSVVVRGSFTHERLKSGTPGLDYTQNVFLLGLRLQR